MSATAEVLERAAASVGVLDRINVHPWVVIAGYMVDDADSPSGWRYEQATHIVWATFAKAPLAEAFVPAGATFARGEVFQAERFTDMPATRRMNYRAPYRCWLMARKARALGKAVADMQPWQDYDPPLIDMAAQDWAEGRWHPAVV